MAKDKKSDIRFITIGEVLLRLSPPNRNTLRTANSLDMNYGGAEMNVAASLANMGIDSTLFSVLPDTNIGKSAIRCLKANDVHTSPIIMEGERMGIYFLEEGFGVRASKVIYDRAHSAFSEYDFSKVDMKKILKNYTWLHLSGITPPLSESCKDLIMNACVAAKELGLTVSFDGNYRSKLWGWQEARDCISRYLPYVDVLIGIEPLNLLGPDGVDMKEKVPNIMDPTFKEQDRIFKEIDKQYGGFQLIDRHIRRTYSGSENGLHAFMYYQGETYESTEYKFSILDRVGSGDAFSSGLIYAFMSEMKPDDMINFAVASSVMKHTIHGDLNITDDIQSIYDLMNQVYDVRR